MFIEVYSIPSMKFASDVKESMVDVNKRLLSIQGIRVRHSSRNVERCVIIMPNGDSIDVAGTYDEIVARIQSVTQVDRV